MLFQKYAQRSTKALKIKNKFVRNHVRKSNKKTEKSLVNVVFTRLFIWQGQKGSNPRHAVLETAALPTELYPYMQFEQWWGIRDSNPGPTGYEPVALTN